MQLDFAVETIERVEVTGPKSIDGAALMSPYVWQQGKTFCILLRVVPPSGTTPPSTGSIWYGESYDGLHFKLTHAPVIAPSPGGLDVGGCEDPTPVLLEDRALVYYTGVDAAGATGQLLVAEGPNVRHLGKTQIALASSKSEGNTKEASIDRTLSDGWRLFYEYAHDEASLVGLAIGPGAIGPWQEQPQPFAPRENRWDSWHLSTGPLLTSHKDTPVMFYNGATRDARWRIGWVAFDANYRKVIDRCVEPLIAPPPRPDRALADIAFAASLVSSPNSARSILYYSCGDAWLERAHIRRFQY
jgi:predicted GH43/DUF377 family glycosyl hydrolase